VDLRNGRMEKVSKVLTCQTASTEDTEPKHLLHGVLEITINELKLEKISTKLWAVSFLMESMRVLRS
jgi:hypothetical protein